MHSIHHQAAIVDTFLPQQLVFGSNKEIVAIQHQPYPSPDLYWTCSFSYQLVGSVQSLSLPHLSLTYDLLLFSFYSVCSDIADCASSGKPAMPPYLIEHFVLQSRNHLDL